MPAAVVFEAPSRCCRFVDGALKDVQVGGMNGHFLSVTLLTFLMVPLSLAARPVKVACVGDSITYGAAINGREKNSYPAQLQRLLGDGYVVKNFGNSGSTMLKKGDKPYWKQKEFKAAKEFSPEIVIIKLGTNDTKPQNWKHGSEFVADYKSMIAEFRTLPSKPKIYVCLPVPAFAVRWGISDTVINKDVLPATRNLAKATGATLIDLNVALQGKEEHFPDKIHPNQAGAEIIAQTVAGAIRAESAAAKRAVEKASK